MTHPYLADTSSTDGESASGDAPHAHRRNLLQSDRTANPHQCVRPEDAQIGAGSRPLQDFFDELAEQEVRGRSGESQGFDRVKDMFTARAMFREIYDSVVADKGPDAADRVTFEHARTVTRIYAEIFGVDDEDGATPGCRRTHQVLPRRPLTRGIH